ncbi:MAG: hypothetical protein IT164_05255 [Bryobacterales bacterium]|nr:hypothetical protein [Bryobacterales bacterium]
MSLTPIGLEGLRRAEEKLEKTARELARLPMSASDGAAADQVSLSDSMIALLEARHSYEANLRMIETDEELTGRLIDLTG